MTVYSKHDKNGTPLIDGRSGRGRSKTPLIIILVFLLIAGGGYFAYRYFRIARQPEPVVVSDTVEMKLYYPADSAKLAAKTISIKANSSDKEKAELIIGGLKENEALPANVSLTEFTADTDGTLILNFSPGLTDMKPDPLTEIKLVYSIINSFLANFDKAKSVQLLAGDQAFFTVNGTVYTYKPLEFNSHILED